MSQILELEVPNPSGLHARPAALFVRASSGFRADIRVSNLTTGAGDANAKSILAVLNLGASQGHRICLRIEGEDEAEAAQALRDLVDSGLGEPLPARESVDAPARVEGELACRGE